MMHFPLDPFAVDWCGGCLGDLLALLNQSSAPWKPRA